MADPYEEQAEARYRREHREGKTTSYPGGETEEGGPSGYVITLELSPDEADMLDEASEGRPPTEVLRLALHQYCRDPGGVQANDSTL